MYIMHISRVHYNYYELLHILITCQLIPTGKFAADLSTG